VVARERRYFVYILSNRAKRLYIGVTNDLERRVLQHKRREVEAFTSRYNINQPVYYEETDDVRAASLGRSSSKAGCAYGRSSW